MFLPLRNRLLMWLCSAPLLLPAAHLVGLFTYGDFTMRQSLLIDYFVAVFVVGIWLGFREWWRFKDMPPRPAPNLVPALPRLQLLAFFAIVSVRDFIDYLVRSYIISHFFSLLAVEILGGGLIAFSFGLIAGYHLIAPYFFVVPKSPDLRHPERS